MKTDNATSGSTSARTSADDAPASTDERKLKDDLKNDPQARPNADRPRPLHPESSEADFLTLQQEHAKAAIGRVVSEIKGALAKAARPSEDEMKAAAAAENQEHGQDQGQRGTPGQTEA